MRNHIVNTSFKTLFFLILPILFGSFYFENFENNQQDEGIILDAENILVDKNNPAQFLFDFDKGDIIYLSYGKTTGSRSKGNISDIQVTLSAGGGSYSKALYIGSDVKIPSKGRYQLTFQTNGKKIRLDIELDKEPVKELPELKTVPILKLSSLFVLGTQKDFKIDRIDKEYGIELGEMPTFRFPFKAGDKLTVTSKDPEKKDLLKFEVIQTYDKLWNGSAVSIEEDGMYTVRLFVEKNKINDKGLWARIFRRNIPGVAFEDIIIERTTAARPKEKLSYGKEPVEEIDEGPDLVSLYLESMNKGERERAEMINNMMRQSAKQGENTLDFILALEEKRLEFMNRRDTILELDLPKREELILTPQLDFTKSPKKCVPLRMNPSAIAWVLWIGVGTEAKKTFDDYNQKTRLEAGHKYGSMGMFADIYFQKRQGDYKVFFPSKEREPEIFTERVEYAIFDEVNKKKFLKNETTKALIHNKSASAEPRIMGMSEEKTLHLCFCNNNTHTSTTVYYNYQSITTLEL